MVHCDVCFREFRYVRDLTRHLSGKRGCPLKPRSNRAQTALSSRSIRAEIKNDKNTPILLNNQLMSSISNIMNSNSESQVKCEFCKISLIRRSYPRHIIKSCKYVTDEIRDYFIDKYNNNGNTKYGNRVFKDEYNRTINLKEIIEYRKTTNLVNNTTICNNPSTLSLTNSNIKKIANSNDINDLSKINNQVGNINLIDTFNNNVNNNMNNINNISINNISDYDNDDYSHLTQEDMIKICKSGFDSYSVLAELLAQNKNNINYMIKNIKDNDVYVIKDNKIDIISKVNFKEAKLDRSVHILSDIFVKKGVKEKLSKQNIIVFEDVIDMDKYRESLKYQQYADELFLKLKKFNPRNKEVFNNNDYITKI